MSLIPFSTAWVGMNPLEAVPTLFYGVILFLCAVLYLFLQNQVVQCEGTESDLAKEIGFDWKGKVSMLLVCHWGSICILGTGCFVWFVFSSGNYLVHPR